MNNGFSIGKIFGIKINADWSWLFIFLLVTWNLSLGVFPAIHPQWGTFLSWIIGITASALFFGSVLAHEMAHSLVARARGITVKRITLFLFGGVSSIEKEPSSPSTEFLMAIVGPVTSIVLGLIFIFFGGITGGISVSILTDPVQALSGLGPIQTLLLWLGPVNILVGLFNLIPGFPLDGGRILRSVIWNYTGDLKKSTRLASWAGQAVGILFILTGISMILGVQVPFFGTGVIGGLWIAFIGWFLNSAASQSYRRVVVEDVLEEIPVSRLIREDIIAVSPETSVENFVQDYIMKTDKYAFPVMKDSRLEGIVSLEDVRAIPSRNWKRRKVNQIMTPVDELETTNPKEDISNALNKLVNRNIGQLPVMQNGKLIGMLTYRDITLWLQLKS